MKTKVLAMVILLLLFSLMGHFGYAKETIIFDTDGSTMPGQTVIFERFIHNSGDLNIYFRSSGTLTLGLSYGKQITEWLYNNGPAPKWIIKSIISGDYKNSTEIMPELYQISITNSESISINYEIKVSLITHLALVSLWEIIGGTIIILLAIGTIYYVGIFIKYRFLNRSEY